MSEDRIFGSWGEFVEFASLEHKESGLNSARSNYPSATWDMDVGFDGALELAHKGWPAGEEQAKRISSALVNRVHGKIVQQDIVYAHEGAEIDVGRVCEGEPECWMAWHEFETAGDVQQVFRIVLNCHVSCTINASTIVSRGATLAALAELMEIAGKRVEIKVVWACSTKDSRIMTGEVMVKSIDQPLDLGRVIFALAHPAMFRRLVFSAMESDSRTPSAYGFPHEFTKYQIDPTCLYMGRAHASESRWNDPGFAENWVIEQLEAQGIKLNIPKD